MTQRLSPKHRAFAGMNYPQLAEATKQLIASIEKLAYDDAVPYYVRYQLRSIIQPLAAKGPPISEYTELDRIFNRLRGVRDDQETPRFDNSGEELLPQAPSTNYSDEE